MPNRPHNLRPPARGASLQAARLAADRSRGNANARGYGARWRKYRAWFLGVHPLCVDCKTEPATVVDHIIPHGGLDDPLYWDESNHQGLCVACHNRKTATEDGGLGHHRRNP